MLVLLPLLWLSVGARDAGPPKDTKYVIKRITSCPDVGYFFRRETSPNTLRGSLCFLCFCQNDGTAVCWPRENKRCDVRHYSHGIGKRETRVRRSPIGIGDIFFRDAARDIFNKQLPQVCKPYETSFSEGCPPADWCTGCTVCDCDANGRWDCHVLSFCPDKKDKNKLNKSKRPLKRPPPKRTTAPAKKSPTTVKKKPATKKPPARSDNRKQIKHTRMMPYNNVRKGNNASPKLLIIKKNPTSRSPVYIKNNHSQITLNKNETAKITQEVYKKVVSAFQKMITKKFAASMPSLKNIQKRSLEKNPTPCVKNSKNAKKNVNGPFKSASPNKRQYKKIVGKKATSQKKKFVPPKKKPVSPKYRQSKKADKRTPNKPVKKSATTKKPTKATKPVKRVWRMKREVDQRGTEVNQTEITNTTPINTETLLNTTSAEKTFMSNVTAQDYYIYSVFTSIPSTNNMTNKLAYGVVYENNTNEMNEIDNLLVASNNTDKIKPSIEITTVNPNLLYIENKNNSKDQKNLSFHEIVPEYNDLKFNKRSQFKLLKKSRIFHKLMDVSPNINPVNLTSSSNNSDLITLKSQTRDIVRLVTPNPGRKYNRSKIVNTLRCKNRNEKKAKEENSFKERIFSKIDNVQSTLKKLLHELRQNNTAKAKPSRLNVLRYLKKFFRKVFKKRTGKGVIDVNSKTVFNNHIIKTICDNFENCDRNQVINPALHKKIKELYADSFVILKTINIIKGLLHFLNDPKNGRQISNETMNTGQYSKSKFNNDVIKLSAILKDHYPNYSDNLTDTEKTQIKYIKRNTKAFIASIGKFANKLHKIIYILTQKPSVIKKYHVTRDVEKPNTVNASVFGVEQYVKIRDLLDKYTLLQGALVQRMQQLLYKFDSYEDKNTKKLMIHKHRNATMAIVRYSDNIIKNIRKLKYLAEMLPYSRQRRKRDVTKDDDAMEYLLTLMEYLVKQNNPLDTAPVTDGIDLLIEAIKSAPDIKPIKKKVLQTLPVQVLTKGKTELPLNLSKEDRSIDSAKTLREDKETKLDAVPETAEQNSYHDRDEDQVPRRNLIFEDTNTERVYYRTDTDPSETTYSPMFETTVLSGAYGVRSQIEDKTEHNNFEKLENAIKEDDKKIEVFIADVEDDENIVEGTSTTLAPDVNGEKEAVTVTVPMETTEFKLPEIRERQNNIKSIDVSGSSDGEKRVAFDWLNEGEEQDSREMKSTQNTTAVEEKKKTKRTTKAPPTTFKPHQDNISSITKELNDDDNRRKKSNIEEISYKKQMDLLNSLDYGTERSEDDDSDSKDGDERYSGDIFQSYF